MAELTGSAESFNLSGDGNMSITIPSDAECIIVTVSGFTGTAGSSSLLDQLNFANDSSLEFTHVIGDKYTSSNYWQIDTWIITDTDGNWPGTGADLLYYAATATGYDEGYNVGVYYAKNIDSSSPIFGTDSQQGSTVSSPWNSSIASVGANDLHIIALYNNAATATVTASGQTEILTPSNYNGGGLSMAYEQGVTTMNATFSSDCVPTAFVLTHASGDTNVSASVEALTITEQAATISLDVNVAAAVEALTITEYSASIDVGINILASTESLVITEQAATIVFDVNVNASTEALTITEYAATIDVGGDTTVAVSTEALVITPQAAGIGYDVDIAASTESLVLTTQAATIAVGINVLASVEALSITTQAATIGSDVVVTAATESLVITPQAATIESSGATTLTAQDITNIVDALFAKVIENGETFEQQLKLIRAEAAGKLAQVGNTVTIRDAADTKDRITATVDSNGQRTAITTDVT